MLGDTGLVDWCSVFLALTIERVIVSASVAAGMLRATGLGA